MQIIIRQWTVKPAWISHGLKRIPCWEGQARFIPSVFCMLSFHAFIKRKRKKDTASDGKLCQSSDKKVTCLTRAQIKILGISDKERINVHFSQFSQKHFFTLQKFFYIFFFLFSFLQFWRNVNTFDSSSVSFIPNCSLQPTSSCFASLKVISDRDLQTIL